MLCFAIPTKCLLAWPRKHGPTFLRQVLEVLLAQRPLQISMKIDVLFSYCKELPSDWTVVSTVFHVPVDRGIYRYVISTKILAWLTNSIEVVLMFSKKHILGLKLFTGVTAGAGVNMCLHHAHNWIAVQNNTLISVISFTLKQENWFVNFPRYDTTSVLQQMFGQSKLIIKVWEPIYLTM